MDSSPDHPGAPAASYSGPERRRHPRIAAREEISLTVGVVVDTDVLDISAGGALLSSTSPLQLGDRGHLRISLAREPFNAWVHVVRLQPGTLVGKETRHRIGVSFSVLDDSNRRTLQRFMRDEPRT